MLEEKIMFCKEDSNVMKISILEQLNIINEQIKDIYGLISSVHKYYSALCSSIVGIAILLYSNDVKPSENFNYLYYIVMLVYTLSIVWYRNLLVYLHDLNSITDEYNKFIEINHIISMYRLSYIINVRKLNIVLPFVVGGLACVILLKYSVYNTLYDYVYAMIYPLLFVLGFIWKIDWRVLKSL